MADALAQLESKITAMQKEIHLLRNKTDLTAVQGQLDGFMREIRLIHTGLYETLQKMLVDLNAEGVKRYEGAINAVNTHTTKELEKLINVKKEEDKKA